MLFPFKLQTIFDYHFVSLFGGGNHCQTVFDLIFICHTSGIFDREAGVAGPETLWQMGAVVVVAGLMLWQAERLRLPRTAAPAAPAQTELSKPGGVFWNSSHTIA